MTDGSFQPDSPSADPQTKLRNIFLSALYRQVRLGRTNAEIFKWLSSTNMPPLSEDRLRQLREEFKIKEQKFPDRMAAFRKMLKVP